MKGLPRLPAINKRGPVPPHVVIADYMREQIEAGHWAPLGDPIPSEIELSGAFDVARDTIRRSMKLLREEELIITVAQRGSYWTGKKAKRR
jgi:GntR family transcriptional regulator